MKNDPFARVIAIAPMRRCQVEPERGLLWVRSGRKRKAINGNSIIMIGQRPHPARIEDTRIAWTKRKSFIEQPPLLVWVALLPRVECTTEQLFSLGIARIHWIDLPQTAWLCKAAV